MAFPATVVILPVGIIFILSGLIINVIQVNLIQFNPQYYMYIILEYDICTNVSQYFVLNNVSWTKQCIVKQRRFLQILLCNSLIAPPTLICIYLYVYICLQMIKFVVYFCFYVKLDLFLINFYFYFYTIYIYIYIYISICRLSSLCLFVRYQDIVIEE